MKNGKWPTLNDLHDPSSIMVTMQKKTKINLGLMLQIKVAFANAYKMSLSPADVHTQ